MQQVCTGQMWYYNCVFTRTTTSAGTNNGSHVLTFMRLCSPQIAQIDVHKYCNIHTVHNMYTDLLSPPYCKERWLHTNTCTIKTTSTFALYCQIYINLHSNSLPNTTWTYKEWVCTQHPQSTHPHTHTHTLLCLYSNVPSSTHLNTHKYKQYWYRHYTWPHATQT